MQFFKKLHKLGSEEKLRLKNLTNLNFSLKWTIHKIFTKKQCKYTVYNILGICSVRFNLCDCIWKCCETNKYISGQSYLK